MGQRILCDPGEELAFLYIDSQTSLFLQQAQAEGRALSHWRKKQKGPEHVMDRLRKVVGVTFLSVVAGLREQVAALGRSHGCGAGRNWLVCDQWLSQKPEKWRLSKSADKCCSATPSCPFPVFSPLTRSSVVWRAQPVNDGSSRLLFMSVPQGFATELATMQMW